MARNASIVPAHVVHSSRIQNVVLRVMLHMFASRPVAALTAHVPFGYHLVVDVVVHRMAPVAGGTSGSLHVVGRIEGLPPISPRRNEVRTPDAVCYVPLSPFGKIIVPRLREISLLPQAAVYQRHVVFREFHERVGLRHVRNNRVAMFARIAHHVRHGSLLPSLIDLRMALLAGW